MNLEHLEYPWRKDLEKMEKFYVQTIDSLVSRINMLETRIQTLESRQSNPYVTWTTDNTNTVQGIGTGGPVSYTLGFPPVIGTKK
jgi:hypothetical protein